MDLKTTTTTNNNNNKQQQPLFTPFSTMSVTF